MGSVQFFGNGGSSNTLPANATFTSVTTGTLTVTNEIANNITTSTLTVANVYSTGNMDFNANAASRIRLQVGGNITDIVNDRLVFTKDLQFNAGDLKNFASALTIIAMNLALPGPIGDQTTDDLSTELAALPLTLAAIDQLRTVATDLKNILLSYGIVTA